MSETKGEEETSGELIKETLFRLEEIEEVHLPLEGDTKQLGPDAAPAVTLFGKGESRDSGSHLYDLFQQSIWTSGDENSGLGDRSNLHKLRGKVLMHGVQSLSNGELLTLVLSTGAGS